MKFEIDIPEGYKLVAFRAPKSTELFIDFDGKVVAAISSFKPKFKRLIVKKIEPKRIVLERVERSVKNPMKATKGDFWESSDGLREFTSGGSSAGKYIIWRRVEK